MSYKSRDNYATGMCFDTCKCPSCRIKRKRDIQFLLYHAFSISFVIVVMFLFINLVAFKAESYSLPNDACLEWALGENAHVLGIWEIDDEWNKRHKDIFEAHGYDEIQPTLDKIGEICLARNIG